MPLPFNPKLKNRARELRKNMTESEKALWAAVRRKQLDGVQFYRQKNIGHYIVDFYCPAANLIVEVDGDAHFNKKADATTASATTTSANLASPSFDSHPKTSSQTSTPSAAK